MISDSRFRDEEVLYSIELAVASELIFISRILVYLPLFHYLSVSVPFDCTSRRPICTISQFHLRIRPLSHSTATLSVTNTRSHPHRAFLP